MIEKLLTRNESKTLEFKENAQSLGGIIKTVVSFANSAGGIIVIGIQDKTKKIIGVPNALQEEERLVSAISDSICPFIIPNIEIQTYRKKELIIIDVPHLAGPCYVKKNGLERGVYIRFGSTNRLADDQALEALKLYAKKISFDEIPYLHGEIIDLDWEFIKNTFRSISKEFDENKARDLGLVTDHCGKLYPTMGGIILFGFNRSKVVPYSQIRCVRFLGTDKSKSKVLDSLEITSYPILALQEAIRFIEKNSFIASEIVGIRREEIPQFPPIAIREALINAIIHADYSLHGSFIMISIFDDRVEISNPGGLLFGMTLDRAIGGSSRVRNKVIARVFRELKLTEQWGSGLRKIIDACQNMGLEEPKFEDHEIEFKVTLYSKVAVKTALDKTQKEFMNYLKKRDKISTKQAADFWGIATRNARSRLKKLLDLGVVTRIGTSENDPLGGYILNNNKF